MKLCDFVDINPRTTLSKGSEAEFVPMEALDPSRRYVKTYPKKKYSGGTKFVNGDTLFARITPCLENGKISQFTSTTDNPAFGSTEYWILRAKDGVSDPGFVYYLAKSDLIRKTAEKSMVGASGRQRAQIQSVQDLDIGDVSLTDQRKIAGVLGAYDDLIENNSKRIEKLETMARLLYRHYFESVEAGQRSRIPLLDSIELKPKTVVPKDGDKPYVPMESLQTNSMVLSFFSKRAGNSGSKFEAGDTLFARITPSLENGKTGFVYELPDGHTSAFGSTEFIVMRSKTLSPEIVYLVARSDVVRRTAIKSMVGASGRQRVQEKCFAELTLPEITETEIQELTEKLRPMYKQINILHKKNVNLSEARDLLLPRLMSGEIVL